MDNVFNQLASLSKMDKILEKRPTGRPPMPFDVQIADEFLTRLEAGESIRSICADAHMVSWPTICRWRREVSRFEQQYACAREASGESCEHNAIDAAMSAVDNESANAARVRSDIWKWAASKRHPKVYGDKITADININTGLADRLSAALQRTGRVVDVEPIEDKSNT